MRIRNWDWRLGIEDRELEIGIGDCDRGLEIGIRDYDWELGI